MKIEIHLLQNVAPSCLNRDDTNTPKTCEFGGAVRARVSSQSWKRAVREFFREANSATVAVRTKHLQERLLKALGTDASDSAEVAKVTKFINEAYSKMDGKRPSETAVLLFIPETEIAEAAACIREGVDIKTAIPRLQKVRQSADVALFGRMLAEIPVQNIDASCQVAHAISTHAVDLETDFYTAVDDLTQDRDETGAGMLGTQGFNSACFYRYAIIDRDQLVENLGGDATEADKVIRAFLQAFTLAIPAAKQNSHAAQNPPSFGLFVARESGVPVSLANAFASPVPTTQRFDSEPLDIVSDSIRRLVRYQGQMQKVYGLYDGATLAVFHDREDNLLLGNFQPDYEGGLSDAISTVMKRVSASGSVEKASAAS